MHTGRKASFTRTMSRLPISLAVLALVAAACFFVAQDVGARLFPARVPEAPASGPTRAEVLISEHDCWTGAAPADVAVPGHVVVSADGETWYAGARVTGLALEQVFDGVDHGLRVHAFCR